MFVRESYNIKLPASIVMKHSKLLSLEIKEIKKRLNFNCLNRLLLSVKSKIDSLSSNDEAAPSQAADTSLPADVIPESPILEYPSAEKDVKTMTTETVSKWKSGLLQLSSDLLGLSHASEKEFLFLGDRLNNISAVNRHNSDLADKVVENLNKGKAEDLDLLKGLLNSGFEKADDTEISLSRLSSELKKMIGSIKEIVHLMDQLDRTYRSLRIVRVMIRIEAEQADYPEFHTVAEALKTTEALILKNAKTTHSSAAETIQLLLQMRARIDSNKNSRQLPLKEEQKSILSLITEISRELSQSVKICQQMKAFSGAIAREINEVVTNLQFHDNYRQRMEHISEILEEVASRVPEVTDDNKGKLIKLKPWGTTVVNLQIAQLENLKKENGDVSHKLSGSFGKILEMLQKQSEASDRLIPAMMSLDHYIGNLDRLLKNFCTHLGIYKTSNQELMRSTEHLSDHILEITKLNSLIKSNELNLRILAINSIIKATSIRRRGKPLAVLSREINTISQSVQQQLSEGEDKISAAHSGSDYIAATLLENLKDSMKLMDETFDRTGENILNLLEKDENASSFSQTSHRLKADFSDLMEKLQFAQSIDDSLSTVIQGLHDLSEEFESLLPDPPTDSVEDDLDLQKLIGNYTMQTERDIHEANIDSDLMSEEVDIFECVDTDGQESSTDQSDQDLGDNIELF